MKLNIFLTKTCFGTAHEFTNTFWQCGQTRVSSLVSDALDELPDCLSCRFCKIVSPPRALVLGKLASLAKKCDFWVSWDEDGWASLCDENCAAMSSTSGNGPNEGKSLSILLRRFLKFVLDPGFMVCGYWYSDTCLTLWRTELFNTFDWEPVIITHRRLLLVSWNGRWSRRRPFNFAKSIMRNISQIRGGTWSFGALMLGMIQLLERNDCLNYFHLWWTRNFNIFILFMAHVKFLVWYSDVASPRQWQQMARFAAVLSTFFRGRLKAT